MKAFKEPINYEGLEEELHEALRADELYALQNDAKFRAIEQSVPTYEDFRQMVNAAHLKPLERKDVTPKLGVKWNAIADDRKYSQSMKGGTKKTSGQEPTEQLIFGAIPKDSHEFLKVWKNLDCEKRIRLLNETRPILTSEIFRSEIPPNVLNECIVACLESLETPDSEKSVMKILSTLSECNRFKLAIEFMSPRDKSTCRELFQALRKQSGNVESETILRNLEATYLVEI
ncbi:coiled-coil domain-containing protein 103 [Venturia canescens]|uniref:coiled-coil domain-containing protein 103 n=1 Tax=Venturia canescens TaxID=32260 RepID=UPI001C9D183B|nr:coiled-coil domain-containing protein 103 [Venturia canescens]